MIVVAQKISQCTAHSLMVGVEVTGQVGGSIKVQI